MDKRSRLLSLARIRQSTRWEGYTSIADYHGGVYECDFVSPYTKTAGNVDAEVMVLLQDWSSHEALSRELDEGARDLGYSRNEPTSRNLAHLLSVTFGFSLADVYGTNLFPFVKPSSMQDRIPIRDLVRAAHEFALPQVEIVSPRLVVCLGKDTFNALRIARRLSPAENMETAINSPFRLGNSLVWCQAHTGARGRNNRNKGGVDLVTQDWLRMKREALQPGSISSAARPLEGVACVTHAVVSHANLMSKAQAARPDGAKSVQHFTRTARTIRSGTNTEVYCRVVASLGQWFTRQELFDAIMADPASQALPLNGAGEARIVVSDLLRRGIIAPAQR